MAIWFLSDFNSLASEFGPTSLPDTMFRTPELRTPFSEGV